MASTVTAITYFVNLYERGAWLCALSGNGRNFLPRRLPDTRAIRTRIPDGRNDAGADLPPRVPLKTLLRAPIAARTPVEQGQGKLDRVQAMP